jgi:hypothetical protein
MYVLGAAVGIAVQSDPHRHELLGEALDVHHRGVGTQDELFAGVDAVCARD